MALRQNLIIVLLLLGLSRIAWAQYVPPSPTGTIPPLRGPLPTGTIPQLPQTRGPFPRIGLPLPSIGLPPARDRFIRERGFTRPVVGGGYYWPNVVYSVSDPWFFAPSFDYPQESFPEPMYNAPPSPTSNIVLDIQTGAPPTGYLVMDVHPGTAEVFVDGYYAGSTDDLLHRGELPLEPGPHTVEVNAGGYEPVRFDVRIVSNESIAYRRDLKAINGMTQPQPRSTAPGKPKTFYMIPGCYLGDVPPKDAGLPASCDLSRAVTITP